MSAFDTLNSINVNGHTEQKNGLTYLSWAWAWGILLKNYPDSVYTIYENKDGLNYHTDGRTCWVKTGVTVEGKEYIEYLPIMDFRNKSIPLENVTSMDVNKAIQRSLTKAVARHGLGLYIYAGEDLPEDAPAVETVPAELAPTNHPKAEKPATVTQQYLTEAEWTGIETGARKTYGDNAYAEINKMLVKYNVASSKSVPLAIGALIKAQIKKDFQAKKGAEQ
jgi:hypothetical protein